MNSKISLWAYTEANKYNENTKSKLADTIEVLQSARDNLELNESDGASAESMKIVNLGIMNTLLADIAVSLAKICDKIGG